MQKYAFRISRDHDQTHRCRPQNVLMPSTVQVDCSYSCPSDGYEVCGIDESGKLTTYPNACEATCAGAFCTRTGPCVLIKRKKPDSFCYCLQLYDPVCGIRVGGSQRTYGNSCEAGCDAAFCSVSGACGSSSFS